MISTIVRFSLFFLILLIFSNSIHALDSISDLNPKDWRYGIDPYGSKAIYEGGIVGKKSAKITLLRTPQLTADKHTWVELIFDLPSGGLTNVNKVKLTYKCDRDLIVKLSQKDYGGEGDNSYAHYQKIIEAQDEWSSVTLDFSEFKRPTWTPKSSMDKGIIKEHVNALYFVPNLDEKKGGLSVIEVQHIELLP